MSLDKKAYCQRCNGLSGPISLNADLGTLEWQIEHYRCKTCGYDILQDPEKLQKPLAD